ncbi:MAG: hypothetical protein ACTSUO_00880, partial [Candidatus Thorarchaeota archaeon]
AMESMVRSVNNDVVNAVNIAISDLASFLREVKRGFNTTGDEINNKLIPTLNGTFADLSSAVQSSFDDVSNKVQKAINDFGKNIDSSNKEIVESLVSEINSMNESLAKSIETQVNNVINTITDVLGVTLKNIPVIPVIRNVKEDSFEVSVPESGGKLEYVAIGW